MFEFLVAAYYITQTGSDLIFPDRVAFYFSLQLFDWRLLCGHASTSFLPSFLFSDK